MKRIYLAALLTGLSAIAHAETFTGVITDTMCGVKHEMMKGQPDAECVKMCASGRDEYALYDGTNVINLSDQKLPARFAGRKVRVTGALDAKKNTIKVTAIEPADK
jgi:hypothetical protein